VPKDHFGERIAAKYDESAVEQFDPAVVAPVVDFLAALAGDGAALELGIGTGRIALPLADRGVPVHGIDLSEAMVARLRAKPGCGANRRDHRRLCDDDGPRDFLPRVRRLQHGSATSRLSAR
jgi:SAM-dependent methyltransferase